MAKGTAADVFKLVRGDDGKRRPEWAAHDLAMRDYFDNEWGVPVHSEQGVFERLSLEVFQSGLSWSTILAKRPAFRKAFAEFDPDKIAKFGQRDIDRLLADEGIIRNKRKVEAVVQNAGATVALRGKVDGGLPALFWSHAPKQRVLQRGHVDVPRQSPESEALAAELRVYGFTMVGPVNVFASMCAIGVVDVRGQSGIF